MVIISFVVVILPLLSSFIHICVLEVNDGLYRKDNGSIVTM